MRKFSILILAVIMLAVLSSCGGADDAEILSALEELAPRAYVLYNVVYGDGLPHGEIDDDGYAKVSKTAEYQSMAELEKALFEVFTPEYCQVICNTAFGGVSVDEGTVYAKFGEDETGFYVNPSVTESFAEPRQFDVSNATITRKTRFIAEVRIEHEDGDITVALAYIDGKWLIDSPIF